MINKLSFGLLIFITFFLCSCAGITLTPTPTPQPMGTQDIVFVSDREGNDDLFLINSDGSGLAALTTDPGEDRGPVWSYDGRLIAYWSLRNDNNDIYTISPDGSDEKRLTTDEYRQWSPTWLRDSQHILY
ncbi:MAG TPA: hypothetical protein VFF78_01835, partial [Anaerolineaceae bacterium]|nr:hypothetical protein [Anaerolineaceae bacterium]